MKEIGGKELATLESLKTSLGEEIESLEEQSTVLHSLYARQDQLLKR